MTFSLVGYCERTGMVGMAVTTSSICVGARCVWVEAGVGAVATQNLTDPRLGSLGLDLLRKGYSAGAAVAEMVKAGAYPEHRQLGVITCDGHTAAHTGEKVYQANNEYLGENVVAIGNLLSTIEVPVAMGQAFEEDPGLHLAERLLRGLEAGKAAGGEVGKNEHSAGLMVYDKLPFALVDLRVDWHDEPAAELRRLWARYEPEMADFMDRATHPNKARAHPTTPQ
ncbi:MAG: DUF1028 domain-containing protein [Chloroflexi bacterium]|nr:DUF1028 domain-containing protein [Chloroflexota bacterium]